MTGMVHAIDLYGAGAGAAEELLLDVFRIEKALDPLDTDDFTAIVHQLSRALRGVAQPIEDASLRRALERLDVDWPNLSGDARSQVIRAASLALRRVEDQVLPAIDEVLELDAERVVGRTRRSVVRRMGLRIQPDMTRRDQRTATFARESQANFVRDEYGRRRESFSERARDVVAQGLERGLGRDDIASELAAALEGQALSRGRDYWEIVSMVFTNRARTFTQLGAFEEAAIERYRYDAVLDESTSEICRLLHGRVFSVQKAARRVEEVERLRNPEGIRDLQPFVQVGADNEGNQVLFYERGGRRRAVAEVEEPGFGRRDAVGAYRQSLSTGQLEAAGLSVPPVHGRCRSTIVAEV